jgi:hypothetical protein
MSAVKVRFKRQYRRKVIRHKQVPGHKATNDPQAPHKKRSRVRVEWVRLKDLAAHICTITGCTSEQVKETLQVHDLIFLGPPSLVEFNAQRVVVYQLTREPNPTHVMIAKRNHGTFQAEHPSAVIVLFQDLCLNGFYRQLMAPATTK